MQPNEKINLSNYRMEKSKSELETAKLLFQNGIYKTYVFTNKIDKEIGKTIVNAERSRNDSDYKDFYIASKESADKQIQNTTIFISHLEKYILLKQSDIKNSAK